MYMTDAAGSQKLPAIRTNYGNYQVGCTLRLEAEHLPSARLNLLYRTVQQKHMSHCALHCAPRHKRTNQGWRTDRA